MEGSLYKWANAIFGWQLKHVEIKNNELRYYKSKGGKLQGIIPLTGCNIEIIANEPLRIIIQLSDGSVLYLKCQSVSDKVKWVSALSIAQHKDKGMKKQEELSIEELPPVKEELARLFKSRILNNSAKLNSYVTQTWTLQGLLEAALSDFSEEFSKLGITSSALKENAESIKRYTMEIKVFFSFL